MELIYIRTDGMGNVSSGYLSNFEAAFAISTDIDYVTNNFTLTMAIPEDEEDVLYEENLISTIVFVDGTEYGGEIKGYTIDEEANTITYTGRTWRGTMSQYVIEPPSGQDYLVVSGNLADSLALLPWSDYIDIAPTDYSGGSFQFDRYIKVFEGATKLLKAADSSLRIGLVFESSGSSGTVTLTVQPARDLASLIEVSQDYNDRVSLKITRDDSTPKVLICLGQGELKNRQVVKLYADDDWNVSTTPIVGAYPVETYDYSSSTALEADGRKQFAELIANHEKIELTIDDLDVRLSDIISGKDILTGQTVKAEITSITWRCTNYGEYQEESYEYRTEVLI